MKYIIAVLVCCLVLASCGIIGKQKKQGQGIVSLIPSATEIICALGHEVGDCINPNLEAIVRLRPAYVFAGDMQKEVASKLRGLGLRTVVLPEQRLDDIYASITEIGRLLGCPERATALVRSVRDSLMALANKQPGEKKKRVLLVVGRDSDNLTNIFTVNRNTFLSELLDIAGGESVFDDAAMVWASISVEEIIRRNPEYVIELTSDSMGTALWQRLGSVSAVKQNHVHALTSDFVFIPGPRVVETARLLQEILCRGEQ